MRFQEMINKYSRVVPWFAEIGEKNALSIIRNVLTVDWRIDTTQLSEKPRTMLNRSTGNETSMIELYILSKAIGLGPKIFRPGQIDFEMLEQTDLNIPFSEYVQPFDTMIIELPENYFQNRIVDCPQAGMEHYGEIMPEQHHPTFIILQHDSNVNTLCVFVLFSSNFAIKTMMVPTTQDDEIEEYIHKRMAKHLFPDSLDCSKEEWEVLNSTIKAAMNYALLIDEFGCKRISETPSHLQKFLDKAKKSQDKERVQRAERNIKLQPVYFALNQEVKLYKTVNTHEELGVSTDRTVTPHHRRGFYKMQPWGPKNLLRKRIRIPPVFVNKHLFFGKMSDTTSTYES